MRGRTLITLGVAVLIGCASRPAESVETEAIREKFANYTIEHAGHEGYHYEPYCLNATHFGEPAQVGTMGFHAIDASRLAGPLEADRPQAIIFDGDGNVLGVEYKVLATVTPEPPQLFGRIFTKLPPHPGVDHEHYALHVWFIENPGGQFADINKRVSCATTNAVPSAPAAGHAGH